MIALFCCVIVVLNAADYVSTRIILTAGGVEKNPVARWFIERKLFLCFKSAATSLMIFCLWILNLDIPVLSLILSLAVICYYGWVVCHNACQIMRLRSEGQDRRSL